MIKSSYQNLCTEFYDLTKPRPGPLEWAFYDNLLQTIKGPCLEAMCGSGRLLVPLLEKGYSIEGVDNSPAMLENCREKCEGRSIPVKLYQQSLHELTLPYHYSLIFIAIGSFHHIRDINEALNALYKLRQHLAPGGTLVLETFLQQGPIFDNPQKTMEFKWVARSPKGYEIVNKSIVRTVEQDVLVNQMRYEKWEKEELRQVEETEWYIRSYQEIQMRSMLHQAGFLSVKTVHEVFELNPKAILYFAS